MTNKFSKTSERRKNTCHSILQGILEETLKIIDIVVLEGHRPKERQEILFKEGKSQLHFPNSFHNKEPSLAFDIAPYNKSVKGGVDWDDKDRFILLAGVVIAIAKIIFNVDITWGGDWNNDTYTKDNEFNDLCHFELILCNEEDLEKC